MSRPPRPEDYLVEGGGAVVVPGHVAARLRARFRIDDFRVSMRDVDPTVYAALTAFHIAALCAAPGPRNIPAPAPEQRPELMTTEQAAAALGIGARGVRQAVVRRRLPAQRVSGAWQIRREDVEAYRRKSA